MSRVESVARALYEAERYPPRYPAWPDLGKDQGYYLTQARTALCADDTRFGVCRVCGGPTKMIASFGLMPLANSFTPDAPRHPLRVECCDDCVLPQLEETVDPAEMFCDYPYLSSQSKSFVAQAKALVERQQVGPDDLVVEIGSNDGYLLRHYDCRVLGVDPSNVEADVETVRMFFDAEVATDLRMGHGPAKVMHANNVVAHCPDPRTVFDGIAILLDPEGTCYVESPYVANLDRQWDTIYHEHVFYWSVTAMIHVAERAGLVLCDVEPLDLHGGSLRYVIRHHGYPSERVLEYVGDESQMSFANLNMRIYHETDRIRRAVATHRNHGRKVCGYGAAAKGSVLVAACGLDLDFVCDTTPTKQGKTMPGTHIPIVATDRLADADVAVLLAWNFEAEIKAREAWWRGTWVLPHIPVAEMAAA